jgi:hypothetical protein
MLARHAGGVDAALADALQVVAAVPAVSNVGVIVAAVRRYASAS